MAWISAIRVSENNTVFADRGNAKAEREIAISFAPGELKADDAKAILCYCREMGALVKSVVAESLQEYGAPEVRVPPSGRKIEAVGTAKKPAPTVDASSEEEYRDKYGNVWPAEVTCKECGTTIPVGKNRYGEPFVICSGTELKPHKPHFLRRDGSFASEAGKTTIKA